MKPLVSVIMPAYNGEKYIEEAIKSILDQTYDNFELIIIEDKSKDNTLNIIRKFQDSRICLYLNYENRGISYSTNLGIQKSKGKYIALLDDDDMALHRRLEWQVEYMETHNEVDILGGRSALIDPDGKFIRYDSEPIRNSKYIKANLLFYNKKFANCTAMIRRSFIEKNNLRYEENCLGMQDLKFYMDSSKVGTLATIDQLIHLKRIHDEEETVRSLKYHEKERKDLFAKFQRESIQKSGFYLEDVFMRAINDNITEKPKKFYSKKDVFNLFHAFKEIIKQARAMDVDYLPELEYACKKILGDRVLTRADIFDWDNE